MNKIITIVLIILNILGFLTFVNYYGYQLKNTNPFLWIFVPDCQLSSLFFAIALIFNLLNKKNDFINLLGTIYPIKYGFWTIFVLIMGFNYYFSSDYFLVLFSHIILFLEPFLIIKKFKLSKSSVFVFIYLFFNDFSDYFLGTHPPLPISMINLMAIITPLLTLLFLLFGLKDYLRKLLYH